MTDKRVSDLPELLDPVNNDEFLVVDVSDTTSSPEGTTKKLSLATLFNKSQFFGWANYEDSQYTELSPQSFPAGVRTLLTNNTGGAQTNEEYLNEPSPLWANDKIMPAQIGDAYDLRISFKAKSATADNFLTLELDIGDGSPVVIFGESRRLLKTAGTENRVAFAIPIFALDTFILNGGKIYVTANADIDVYETGILLIKTFRNIQ